MEGLIPKNTLVELRRVIDKVWMQAGKKNPVRTYLIWAPGIVQKTVEEIEKPDEYDQVFWDFASGLIADVASDIAGPDVVFHHSKLNFNGMTEDEVKWHQDAQFFPHTNYNVFTIGSYLNDTGLEDGPLAVMPGSHQGELYNLYHGETWAGCLTDEMPYCQWKMLNITGGEGSITIHNCRTLHFSPPASTEPRPLLLNCYTPSKLLHTTSGPFFPCV